MTDRCVLVTGASGFVAEQALQPLARRGFRVHALGRRRPRVQVAGFHAVDLQDTARVDEVLRSLRPSHVLHAAWYVVPERFWTAPENHDWVAMTARLAQAAKAVGVQRFIGVGSCAEYSWADGGAMPRRETDALGADTVYGAAKVATFQALQALGGNFAWARLFHLVGEHQPPGRLVPLLLQALLAGREAVTGPGHYQRDYLDVQDVGEALAALVDCDVQGAVNVARGQTASVAQVGAWLGDLTGRPELLAHDRLPPRASDPPVMAADITRLRAATGFAPSLSLVDSLARCVAVAQAAAATDQGTPQCATSHLPGGHQRSRAS